MRNKENTKLILVPLQGIKLLLYHAICSHRDLVLGSFKEVSTLKLSNDGEWIQSLEWLLMTLRIGLNFFFDNVGVMICCPILNPILDGDQKDT